MISSIQQYIHNPDGSIFVKGQPGLTVDAIEDQDLALATTLAQQLEKDLGLPHYLEDWQKLAKVTGMSSRRLSFVIADESESRFKGNPRYQAQNIAFSPSCLLEFGHRGFAVGLVSGIIRYLNPTQHDLKSIGVNVPVEGSVLLGQAQLFDSLLADKAWEGLHRQIFTHVCPILLRPPGEPIGSGSLMEVSLITGDRPGCRNARILKTWEGAAE